MSRHSSGRHRKSRMPSRRTLTVMTGAAGVVVAVTSGAVPMPLVAPGDAHQRDARAEPVTLFVDSASPSAGSQDETGHGAAGSGAGAGSGTGSEPRTTQAPTAKPTPSPTAAASTPPTEPGRSRGPSATQAPSDGPVPAVPVPLPSTTSSFPDLPGLPLPFPLLPQLP